MSAARPKGVPRPASHGGQAGGPGRRGGLAAAGSVAVVPFLTAVLLPALVGGGDGDGTAAWPAVGPPAHLRPGAVPAVYLAQVEKAGQACPGVTAPLLAAQLEAESSWNPRATSVAGARGLAQFIPSTWLSEGVDGNGDGVRDPLDPDDAIASQARYMCRLLATVRGAEPLTGDPLDLALAAYNAGLGAVRRYAGVPPYPETQRYVAHIRSRVGFDADAASSATGAGPPGSWQRPLGRAPITSGFGARWGRLHAGVDFAAPVGSPVYAASGGTVVAAGPASGFGQWVKLDHAGGTSTVYGHISRATVHVGEAVRAGQLIAYSGNEGRSTGPHLHFETRSADRPVDPVTFYAAHGVAL